MDCQCGVYDAMQIDTVHSLIEIGVSISTVTATATVLTVAFMIEIFMCPCCIMLSVQHDLHVEHVA